jgi:hypothetical protein
LNTSDLHASALQAQAAYANLSAGASGTQLASALGSQANAGFSDTQAQQFAAKYSFVLQCNNDASPSVGNDNGLSLTVFKDSAPEHH